MSEAKKEITQTPLQFTFQSTRPTASIACITVPSKWFNTIYHHAAFLQQKTVTTIGFKKGEVPLSYIEKNFASSLVQHTHELLLNYSVINFLYQSLRNNHILFLCEPKLVSVERDPDNTSHFKFEVFTLQPIEIHDWKYLPFKSPKRKLYKDLDRQVELFVKEEKTQLKKRSGPEISPGDWVHFSLLILNSENKPLFTDIPECMWYKVSSEDIDKILSQEFIGKKAGDSFIVKNRSLQHYLSKSMDVPYTFEITIIDAQPHAFFCLDEFKQCFKLKTNKEALKKLVEVFSYRNDLSQRRSMAIESLQLLMKKNQFDVPNHLKIRQQAIILDLIKNNPDYHVYRNQKDFKKQIEQLATRQTKESLLLQQLSFLDNISVTTSDVKQYLNLIKRPRTKEFVYFDPIVTKISGQEVPITTELLKQICLPEKTLNYIIFHLTK